jgi:hypothetical protein
VARRTELRYGVLASGSAARVLGMLSESVPVPVSRCHYRCICWYFLSLSLFLRTPPPNTHPPPPTRLLGRSVFASLPLVLTA